jgi:O-antigen ligase
MASAAPVLAPSPAGWRLPAWLRRRNDVWLALTLGFLVAMLILNLPMRAAMASSVVGAFIIVALVDTRVALLSLLSIRAAIDVTATVGLLPFGEEAVNANAMMSLLLVGFGCAHIAVNRVNIRRIPLATPFAAFAAITSVGLLLSPDRGATLQDWLRVVATFMLYVLIVDTMRREQDRVWLVRVIVIAAVVPLIAGLYQFAFDAGNHSTPGYNRLQATFVHPSVYAFFLIQVIPVAWLLLLHTQSRLARLALGLMVPLLVFNVFMTQTRGAWIGLAVLMVVFLWTRARATIVLVPLIAVALVLAVPSMRERVSGINEGRCNSETDCESSVLWREKQWQAAIDTASPLHLATVGTGLGSVKATLGNSTHNEVVRLFVETGLPGLLAVFLLYRGLFGIAVKGYRDAKTPYHRDLMLAFIMALVARVVIALGDNILALVVLEWYFWAFAGLIVVQSGAYERFAAPEPGRAAPKPGARAAGALRPLRPGAAPT